MILILIDLDCGCIDILADEIIVKNEIRLIRLDPCKQNFARSPNICWVENVGSEIKFR